MTTLAAIREGLAEGPVWLLDLDVGGRVYRVATRDVEVTTEAGRAYRYRAGLGSLTVSTSDEPVARLAVEIDIGENWALQVARGVPLDRRRATLRRWWPGQTWEAAEVTLSGLTEEPEYGDQYEPLSATVVRDPLEGSGLLLEPLSYVSEETWPDDHVTLSYDRDDGVEGQYYPLVIGYPGDIPTYDRGPRPAVPVLLVSQQGSADANVFVVCAEAVGASTVRVTNTSSGVSGDEEDRTVNEYTDGLGVDVPGIDMISAATLSSAGPGDAIWVGFGREPPYGGGILGTDGEVLRGAGDVIEHLLRRYAPGIRFDFARFAPGRTELNHYKVDTYINARESVWTWIRDVLLSQLPAVVRESSEGVYLATVQWDATAIHAVAHLDADLGRVVRDGRIRSFRQGVYNEFTVEYRGAEGGAGKWWSRRILGPKAGENSPWWAAEDYRLREHARCRLSAAVYGYRPYPQTIQIPWTWDDATADRIADDMATRYTAPRRTVRYTGGWELEALEPWSVVTVTDSEVSLTEAVCLVQQRTVGEEGVELDLILLDHPVSSSRSTS